MSLSLIHILKALQNAQETHAADEDVADVDVDAVAAETEE